MAHFFQLENSEMAQNSNRKWIRDKNGSNFEPSQSYMQMPSRVNISFEVFLSHLKDPRVYYITPL